LEEAVVNAIDLLEKQHRLVEKLFKRFEDADDAEKPEIFEEIASNLVAHDAIEREIFYPACERALDDKDTIRESLVEHGLVEFCVFRADQNRKRPELEQYVTVLKEVVQHHVDEEEDELLPKVKRAIDRDALDALGEKMEARFEAALGSDFRRALRSNLQQVLAGRMRTTSRMQTTRRNGKKRTAKPQRLVRRASGRRHAAHAR
jgi:hemerythrin superfamily protein